MIKLVKIKLYFTVLCFAFMLIGCKKTKEVVVPNNSAPPDNTISNEVIDSYNNRLFITLLGRKATPSEADSVSNVLKNSQLSVTSRNQIISHLQSKPEYLNRVYEIARAELLNGLDTNDVGIFISIFNNYLSQPTYSNSISSIQYQIDRLTVMRGIPSNLKNGSMTIEQMYSSCINNHFYDQLNMGTENFVVSSFQNFLLRYPSVDELENGKRMVDGLSSFLFFKSGNTKDDYLSIFFDSENYREGTARILYKKYLFKEPTTTKLYDLTSYYNQTKNYKDIQKYILSSDEYVYY